MKRMILAFALANLLSITAMAHSPLKSTSPEHKAELMAIPAGIAMVFAKSVRITKVTLTHTAGETHHADKLVLSSRKFETNFDFAPQFRGSGSYKVDWRALSVDGHAIKGSFSFKVAE